MLSVPYAIISLCFSAIIILSFLCVRFLLSTLRPANFPPGPPIIPGIGNLHQIPINKPYFTFWSWTKTYGPVIGLKFGPTNVVVLHRPEQVRELFEKRGAYYAARPKMTIPCEYVFPKDYDRQVVFMSVDFQRQQRKAIRHHLGSAGLEELGPIQRSMAMRLMYDLLQKPQEFAESFRHWAMATPLPMIGGQRAEDLGKEWVENYHHVQHAWVTLLEPGVSPPVDIFPVLGWVPRMFSKWKQRAAYVSDGMQEVYAGLLAHAKQRHDASSISGKALNPGKFEPLLSRILRERDESSQTQRLTDREVSMIGGGILDAAADTSLSTALFLVQAFAAHPHVLRRAQDEIDSLWGRESIPEKIDIDKMPYLTACILEVIRWRPPTPQSVPRECLADEHVLGYRIPKGTTVMINVWAIQHDPDEYACPDDFYPDRYIKHPLGLKRPIEDGGRADNWRKSLYAFGAGRRACPGEQFAMNAMRITFSQLLWLFDITPIGELDTTVETGMHSGLTAIPHPFKVNFIPRSEKTKDILMNNYESANRLLADILP